MTTAVWQFRTKRYKSSLKVTREEARGARAPGRREGHASTHFLQLFKKRF